MTTTLQIWEGIKSSNIECLKQLYQLYHQDIFVYGKRMTKDDQLIEDALHETFISIWKYRLTASVPPSVKQYVLKTFRNQLLRIFKERSATTYGDEPLNFSFEISFENKIIEGEDAGRLSLQVNEALKRLTHRQREIIYYRFFEDLSFDEIAGIMNMQTRATYKLMARAMEALKDSLGTRILGLLSLATLHF